MIEKICPFCQEIIGEDFIKDHIGIEHLGLGTGSFKENKTLDCNKCEEKFHHESELKIHENIAHPTFKFTCGKCGKQFITEHAYNLHLKLVHGNQKVFHKCDHCSNQYKDKSVLVRHQKATHQGLRFKCDECPKCFSRQENLYKHTASFHKKNVREKKKEYQQFRTIFSTSSVLSLNKEILRYECELCEKSFSTKQKLTRHDAFIHKGIKHKCLQCDFQCARKKSLSVHIETVHEMKCQQCRKTFSTSSELSRHMEIHRYECELCEKSFVTKQKLTQHDASVHKGIKHKCSECGYQFSRKYVLMNHFITVHQQRKKTYKCQV